MKTNKDVLKQEYQKKFSVLCADKAKVIAKKLLHQESTVESQYPNISTALEILREQHNAAQILSESEAKERAKEILHGEGIVTSGEAASRQVRQQMCSVSFTNRPAGSSWSYLDGDCGNDQVGPVPVIRRRSYDKASQLHRRDSTRRIRKKTAHLCAFLGWLAICIHPVFLVPSLFSNPSQRADNLNIAAAYVVAGLFLLVLSALFRPPTFSKRKMREERKRVESKGIPVRTTPGRPMEQHSR
jgi:hypothetical protein